MTSRPDSGAFPVGTPSSPSHTAVPSAASNSTFHTKKRSRSSQARRIRSAKPNLATTTGQSSGDSPIRYSEWSAAMSKRLEEQKSSNTGSILPSEQDAKGGGDNISREFPDPRPGSNCVPRSGDSLHLEPSDGANETSGKQADEFSGGGTRTSTSAAGSEIDLLITPIQKGHQRSFAEADTAPYPKIRNPQRHARGSASTRTSGRPPEGRPKNRSTASSGSRGVPRDPDYDRPPPNKGSQLWHWTDGTSAVQSQQSKPRGSDFKATLSFDN